MRFSRPLPASSYRGTAVLFAVLGLFVLIDTGYCQVLDSQVDPEKAFDIVIMMGPDLPTTEWVQAAEVGDVQKLSQLLAEGKDIDEAGPDDRTALYVAAKEGHAAAVAFLISREANTDIATFRGETPLGAAVENRHQEIAIALLKAGAEPNPSRQNRRQSLLAEAARKNLPDVVVALIEAGANVDDGGALALGYAIQYGYAQIAAVLLAVEMDVNVLVQERQTLLYVAAEAGDVSAVQSLLEKGADPEAKRRYEETPIRAAILRGHSNVVTTLLRTGQVTVEVADLNAALYEGQHEIAAMLVAELDLQSLSAEVLDSLLIVAHRAESESVLATLMELNQSRMATREAPIFVFYHSTKSGCGVTRWVAETDTQAVVHEVPGSCVVSYFVDDQTRTLFVVGESSVQAVSIEDSQSLFVEKLPVDLMKKLALDLDKYLVQTFGDQLQESFRATRFRIESFGYMKEGSLAFVAGAWNGVDGTFGYLFVRSGESWKMIKKQGCPRKTTCGFGEITSHTLKDFPDRYKVWHPTVRHNPYVVRNEEFVKTEIADGFAPHRIGSVRFEIDGQETTLHYRTIEGYGCDGDCTMTRELSLEVGDNDPVSVTASPWYHWIMGRYLLVKHRRNGHFELIDIGTGRSVFSKLYAATWVH